MNTKELFFPFPFNAIFSAWSLCILCVFLLFSHWLGFLQLWEKGKWNEKRVQAPDKNKEGKKVVMRHDQAQFCLATAKDVPSLTNDSAPNPPTGAKHPGSRSFAPVSKHKNAQVCGRCIFRPTYRNLNLTWVGLKFKIRRKFNQHLNGLFISISTIVTPLHYYCYYGAVWFWSCLCFLFH